MIGLYTQVNTSKELFEEILQDSRTREETLTPPLRGTIYLFFLTLVLGGLQLTWSIELGYGTPYLLSLGLTKHYTSFVWIAAPLTGIIMQPLVGFFSDRSRNPLGRRRPFLIVGTICVVISLIGLAYFKDVAFFFFSGYEKVAKNVTIITSIIIIYLLDFSINIVQASSRALIIDMVPMIQQDLANAWASRMIGIFNVVGYLNGYLNLPKIAPILGNTEFKALSLIGSVILVICTMITVFTAKEKRYLVQRDNDFENVTWWNELISFFKTMFSTITSLPSEILWICMIQFFAWIGWFPILFYGTTYIAEIYAERYCSDYLKPLGRALSLEEKYLLIEEATRYGSFAFLIFSIISLLGTLFFPLFISERKIFKYFCGMKCFNRLDKINVPFLWALSHLSFSLCMFFTIFAKTTVQAVIIISLCGLSWAITLWAPFSLIATELSSNSELHRSGTILGVHNIFITVPQVLSIIIAGIVFKLIGYKKFEDITTCKDNVDYSFVCVFQISGISALIAMYLTFKNSANYSSDHYQVHE